MEIIVPISLAPLQKNVYKMVLERNAEVIKAIALAKAKKASKTSTDISSGGGLIRGSKKAKKGEKGEKGEDVDKGEKRDKEEKVVEKLAVGDQAALAAITAAAAGGAGQAGTAGVTTEVARVDANGDANGEPPGVVNGTAAIGSAENSSIAGHGTENTMEGQAGGEGDEEMDPS